MSAARKSFSAFVSAFALVCTAVPSAYGATPIVSPTVPGRYLVVYRNGAVPADAEITVQRAGGRLLRRHDRFGMAAVAASAAVGQKLLQDTSVEYVIQDRVVTGTALVRGSALNTADDLRGTAVSRLKAPLKVVGTPDVNPLTPPPAATSPGAGTPGSGNPAGGSGGGATFPAATSDADLYYTEPQGWAVKAVGAVGLGVLGSTAHGAWDTTLGQGVRIAVLDSGMDATHPDIAPNLAFNLSEVDQTAQPSACDDGTPQDQAGHGTWVASLAAGAMGTGTGRTVGVAPAATLLNIKVLQRIAGTGTMPLAQCTAGEASGLVSWLLQGIEDAVAQHADVVVMSLGTVVDLYSGDGAGLKVTFDRVTHAAAQAGVVLLAAAGNDGMDLSNPRYLSLPAQSRDVLAVVASTNPTCAEDTRVGAICAAGPTQLAYYSNHGAPLNAVAAPGGSLPEGSADDGVTGWVRGACSSGKPGTTNGLPSAGGSFGCFFLGHTPYVLGIGTSAAAPLVAGAAALVKAAHPDWDPTAIQTALRATATNVPTLPVGLVNATAAVAFAP